MLLNDIINSNSYETSFEICNGCENHCKVKLFHFLNGKTFASGNNCEKVYCSFRESKKKGTNLFTEKYKLLFSSKQTTDKHYIATIGIPRALGIYENYPFWQTLFDECGIKIVLSSPSTVKLYEKGVRTIMADNICFPAKLMHGHVMDLLEKHVDRIFYPFVVFEQKEDEKSRNSFNCPIVSAYSDVIKSAINTEKNYNVPFDSPVISFKNNELLKKTCIEYLSTTFNISKHTCNEAVEKAIEVQQNYINTLEQRGLEIIKKAEEDNRMVILLAGRPYHTDPLIEHKISQAIADMGVDVITEHAAVHEGAKVYDELNAVTQWAYPNRIFKAAYFAGETTYSKLQMVQLTSFGCGPDAFILDEVQSILSRFNKNLTILKIDDVNNIGSLKLRVRSLIESTNINTTKETAGKQPFVTTKTFMPEDTQKTIIAPFFAEGYSEFVPAMFSLAGYKCVNLPIGSQEDAETGLRYANNDVCYPATIVIGSIINALNSGTYDIENTAVIITQTGGQCRATNYYSLIKNAMVKAGYKNVPLISLATGSGVENQQPGFKIKWQKLAKILIHIMAYADSLNKLYHSAAARETEKGMAAGLREKYIALGCEALAQNDSKKLLQLIKKATDDFCKIIDTQKRVPIIGLVGEIYIKYNSFSHKNVVNWLLNDGIEVVPPSIVDFFSTTFVNLHANKELNIKENNTSLFITDALYRYIRHIVKKYDEICSAYPFYRLSANIFEIAELSKQIISTAASFGEGWFLPGEICHLAQTGVKNIVSLQPFGCIANHIISKGIEKKLREIYPDENMLFLDFDSSTSEANIYNRLHFLVDNARKDI